MRIIDFFGASSRSASERKRNLDIRKKLANEGTIYNKKEYGYDYFDNRDNPTGYQGYHYDGRFEEPAKDMFEFYNLKEESFVFELGPAKGYLLAEFAKLGCNVYGQEASKYAILNCDDLVEGKIILEKAPRFLWKDNQFDLVIAKDVLPHIPYECIDQTIKELIRISKGNLFLDIEVGRSEWELIALKEWDETHLICETPAWWENKLLENSFNGHVNFKILISEED